MQKEATPLWVWLAVALLAIGTLAYATSVYFVEHILALF
jgi:MprA protease rhombosortase-interaction domain-containing protein